MARRDERNHAHRHPGRNGLQRIAFMAAGASSSSCCADRGPLHNLRMQHRHLNHQRFTLAAIDDVIARGRRQDWADLRLAVVGDAAVLDKVRRVCDPHLADPYAQRYQFWNHYVQARLARPHAEVA